MKNAPGRMTSSESRTAPRPQPLWPDLLVIETQRRLLGLARDLRYQAELLGTIVDRAEADGADRGAFVQHLSDGWTLRDKEYRRFSVDGAKFEFEYEKTVRGQKEKLTLELLPADEEQPI